MRPIRFSALKALDPLDEEEKRGENHDRQPDIDEVEHGALQGFLLVCAPWARHPLGGCGWRAACAALFRWRSGPCAVADGFSEASGNGEKSGLNGTHARPMRFLTEPMRGGRPPGPGRPGPHRFRQEAGLSEVLYDPNEPTGSARANGKARSAASPASTTFNNMLMGVVMLLGRYAPMVFVLGVAVILVFLTYPPGAGPGPDSPRACTGTGRRAVLGPASGASRVDRVTDRRRMTAGWPRGRRRDLHAGLSSVPRLGRWRVSREAWSAQRRSLPNREVPT